MDEPLTKSDLKEMVTRQTSIWGAMIGAPLFIFVVTAGLIGLRH